MVGLTVLIILTSIHECSQLPEEPQILVSARMALAFSQDSAGPVAADRDLQAWHYRVAELLTRLDADTVDLLSESLVIGRCLLREQYGEWGEGDEYLARLALVRELARQIVDRARGN